jgi:primosomal protein N' (replication factor Y) (superfamily II helicase)
MSAIAQVEPLTTARALRGPFDYRLPETLRAGVGVGSMLVVPFGRREVLGIVVAMADRSDIGEEKLLAPLRAMELGVPVDLVALAQWIAAQYCSTLARALSLMLPPGATHGARPLSRLVAELTPLGHSAAQKTDDNSVGRLTSGQCGLLEQLLDGPLAATATNAAHGTLRRLADRGLIQLERRNVPRRPRHLQVGARRPAPPTLSTEQQAVLDSLMIAIAKRTSERRLLHGITGSGKTEIYLRAAAGTLEQGRGVIVLVPEIALTPQIVGRFIERFGDTVAVLHSRLGTGQRHDEWRRLRAGEARVCVGPRSAIFAPIEDLGLIVVDEEHDGSYKHEGDPRYDARDVAEQRASRCGALLLSGSATPRPESYIGGPHLRLSHRVDGRPLPQVQILDMRGQPPGLHPTTMHALADLRSAGGKAIVLLNRRGWSNFLSCSSCGSVWSCPDCDVALVLHRGEGYVACHHCGHRELVPSRCECGSTSVARHGAGTERIQHDLMMTLGDENFPIFRLDADAVIAGKQDGGVGGLLRRFEQAQTGVLIGTQMVAKGHDFPDVTLGVVIDADATLRFPDFRAEERTFALIAQLAGRVGRGGQGKVLVQTMAPEARAILHAAHHDSDGFLAGELQRRKALRYPPYSHLIRIVCSAHESARALAAANAVCKLLSSCGASVLGPAPLFRLRGRERQVLVIKATDRAGAVHAVDQAIQSVAKAREHSNVSLSVDVDPQ